MLSAMYIETGRIDDIKGISHILMLYRLDNNEFLNSLLVYAIHSKDIDLYRAAMDGVGEDIIQGSEDTAALVAMAKSCLLDSNKN